jgi:hypothetical protein
MLIAHASPDVVTNFVAIQNPTLVLIPTLTRWCSLALRAAKNCCVT